MVSVARALQFRYFVAKHHTSSFRYLPMCFELRPDVAFAASRRLWLCVGTYYMLRRDVILWNSITIIPPFARY